MATLPSIEAELDSIARLFAVSGKYTGEDIADYATRIIQDAMFPQNYLREVIDLKARAIAACDARPPIQSPPPLAVLTPDAPASTGARNHVDARR